MKKILPFIFIALLLSCKKENIAPQHSHSDMLKFVIDEIVEVGFVKDTVNILETRKIGDLNFPGDSVLTQSFHLWRKRKTCKISFYEFVYDSTNMDSVNAKYVMSSHLGLPFGMPNEILTYLACVPPRFLVHLDTIKYNDYLLLYKIIGPDPDSVFIRELSSTIKTAMQVTDYEQIGPIVSRLKDF